MHFISAQEFKNQLSTLSILDIRTQREWEDFNFGGVHIPLDELLSRIIEIESSINWIVICYNGTQSEIACRLLQAKGFKQIQNLKGGIEAYLSI